MIGSSFCRRYMKLLQLALIPFVLGLPTAVHGATVSFSTTPPALGANDRSNLTSAAADTDNVATTTGGGPGGQDDGTYLADDRPVQGQTFTTGNNSAGYRLTAVTLRHVTYGPTFTLIPDLTYTVRIIRPSGTTLTVVASESAFVPASAPGNFPSADGPAGSGNYLTFRFDSPVSLNPNTLYGFDLSGGRTRHYWETDGVRTDPYAGGRAYTTGATGIPGATLTERRGDRVFVVALSIAGFPIVNTPTISPSNAVYAGTPVTLNVSASGPGPLQYQWRVDGANVPGATGTTLMVDTTPLFGDYNYDVVVSNSAGAVTSAPVALTVFGASAPVVVTDTTPSSATRYAGQDVTFGATFDGTRPISYNWQYFGVDIAGETNITLTVTELDTFDAGDYRLRASNSQGESFSTVAQLTVLDAPPPPQPGTFAHAVLTNLPIHYWRFNDPAGTQLIYDSAGSFNANNNNVTLGVPGLRPPEYPGFPSDNTAGSFGGSAAKTEGSLMNGLSRFTVMGWMQPTGPNTAPDTGLFGQNDALEIGYSDGNGITMWVQLNGTFVDTSTGPAGFEVGRWSFIALVADGTNAYVYVNGLERRRLSGGASTGSSGFTFNIGGGPIFYQGDNPFNGLIEDVALLDKALSAQQIEDLYNLAAGAGPPTILVQPRSLSLYQGRTARFMASGIGGARPHTFQWQRRSGGTFINLADGGNISGSRTNSLTISNVASANAGDYRLIISNSVGSLTSSVVTLTVVQPTGTPYESAALGLNPWAYWRLNETEDPSSGTAPAHDYWGGFAGTYGNASQNGFTSIAGPLSSDGFDAFESTNTALQSAGNTDQSWATVPGLGLNSDTVSFTMWVKPSGAQSDFTGLFMTRGGGTTAGIGYGGVYEDVNSPGQLIYTWNNNTTWRFHSGLLIPPDQWSFVAVVIEPANARLYLYYKDPNNSTDLLLSTNNAIPHLSEGWNGPAYVGSDPNSVGRTFNGIVDEVAVFRSALSPEQVRALYNGGTEVRLSIQRSGNMLTLGWSEGTLQETTNPLGTWTAVPGANPPSYITSATGPPRFFRVLVRP